MKFLLTTAQIAGILSALSFMITAIFPLGYNDSMHSFWSKMLVVFLGFFEAFSASSLRRRPHRVKWMPYYGFLIAIINFMLGVSFFFADFFLGEWIMVVMFIVYVIILATLQNSKNRLPALHGA